MTLTQRRGGAKKSKEDVLVHTPAPAETAFNEQEFRELVQKVQLRDVYLRETRAVLTTSKEDKENVGGKLIVKPIQARSRRMNDTLLYCGVRLDVVAEDGADYEFKIAVFAEYGIFYEIPADITFSKKTEAVFARRNAVFNAWPFFRELVHSTVGKMGIPSIILPTFRLPPTPP